MEDKEKRKYQIKSISGITLMVLVITVILMLILARGGDIMINNRRWDIQ